ncbi:MAG: histidine kinase [Bacteroidales bacterium]|nr:histidine kinase [Bacteroidales bacterium]
MKYLRSIIISTFTGLALFFYIWIGETGSWPILQKHWFDVFLAVVVANVVGLCLLRMNPLLDRYVPWNRNTGIRFLVETVSGFSVLAVLLIVIRYAYIEPYFPPVEGEPQESRFTDSITKIAILSPVIIYLYSLVNFSVFSVNQYSHLQIQSIKTERTQLKLQFEALKNQLSPHFLFNALNTISSLIYRDIKQADSFIRQLAHTYAYILKTDEHQLVLVGHELDMVNDYFEMQKTRFGNSIHLKINMDEDLKKSFIPPLTFQMLVENALKHNQIKENNHLTIEIIADEKSNYIEVNNNIIVKPELLKIGNNLIERPKENGSHKIGLSNIRQRYGYFTGKRVEIMINNKFTVKLPVIRNSNEKKRNL